MYVLGTRLQLEMHRWSAIGVARGKYHAMHGCRDSGQEKSLCLHLPSLKSNLKLTDCIYTFERNTSLCEMDLNAIKPH